MALIVQTKPIDDNTVLFHRIFVDYLGGDVLAALMLSQMFYWYRPNKFGKSKLSPKLHYFDAYWVAKSVAEWQEELGFSPDQVRRCLKVLVNRGVIVTALIKFKGAPTTHFRLTALHGSREVLSDPKKVLIWDESQIQMGLEGGSFGMEPNSYTETTAETTTGEIAQAPSNSPIETNGEDMNLNDVLKKKAEEKSELKSGMEVEWNKRMSTQYGGFQSGMTMKEKGQLKKVRTAAEAVGLKGTDVIRWAIENWTSTASEVCSRVGLTNGPSMPNIGFVCLYSSHVVDVYQQATQAVQSIAQPEPVKQVVKQEPVKVGHEVYKPPQEELDALFATLKAGQAKAGG